MRKWKQRLWSLLLCGTMLVSLCVPAEAVEVIDSGQFGDTSWEWVLDSNGVLTISPNAGLVPGLMPDFGLMGSPWYRYADQIQSVEFAYADSGFCLSVGVYAFQGCTNLTKITLPDSVTAIGDYAFSSCTGLTEITLPESVTTIGIYAFSNCTRLTEITLPGSVTTIGNGAFVYCADLTSITFTSDTPPAIGLIAFADCDRLKEIRVPAGKEDAYRDVLSKADLNLDGGGIELKGGYFITVTAAEGGTASASSDFAAAGEEITLTAVPDSGYRLKEWQVVSGDVTIDSGRRFVMPAEAVTVKAVFEKEAAPQPPSHTHAWAGAWSWNSTHHWHECLAEGCAIVSDSGKSGYAAHTPGDWIVDRSATGSTAGSRHKECTVCGYTTQTETIPATGGGDGGGDGGSGGGGSYTPPTYKPDVPQPGQGGGTPSISPSKPEKGDTVTVTPKPDGGYEVDEIIVTDKDGKPVEVTKKPDGTYTFTQPGSKVTIEVTYRPVQPVERPWNNPFSDVFESDWYYEAVRFVHERGLMTGYEDGRFGPGDILSRAQLAQILFNKEGRPVVNYQMDFADIAGEAWYAEAVRWAASQGIVGGYGNGRFGPDDPITREQLAVMFWRYSGSPAATNKELHFNDADEISPFAREALLWAVESGILNGCGDGRLGPQWQATRAQVAQMLKNFIENQEENT